MENKELDIVFDDLCFDFVPMEKVSYDSNVGSLSIFADLEEGPGVTMYFKRVSGFSFENNDNFDMSIFCPDNFFTVTLYKVKHENLYLFPTEENIWRIYSDNPPTLS